MSELKDKIITLEVLQHFKDTCVPDQIQPDWNQSDETQPDFIKNKPLLTDYVDSSTDQTISGEKTFIKPVYITGDGRGAQTPVEACGKLNVQTPGGYVSIEPDLSDVLLRPYIAIVNSEGTTVYAYDSIRRVDGVGNVIRYELPEEGGTIATEEKLEEVLNDKASIQQLNEKQEKLVSGSNVKTINGESILGEGDIVIVGQISKKNVEIESKLELVDCVDGDIDVVSYSIPNGMDSIEIQSVGSANALDLKYLRDINYVRNGITISTKNGRYTLDGTCTMSGEYFNIAIIDTSNPILLPAGTYNLCGCYGGSATTYRIQWRKINAETDADEGFLAWDDGGGSKVVLTEPKKVRAQFLIYKDAVLENVTVSPMIIEGDTAPDHYVEYKRTSVTISADSPTPVTGLTGYSTGTEIRVNAGSAVISYPCSANDPRVDKLVEDVSKISSDLTELSKEQHRDDAEFTITKLNNSNQFSQNDITFVGDELWVSKQNSIYYTNGTKIFRYKIVNNEFTLVGTCDCDFGHLNVMDYCAANDCLIFGNGANDTETTGNYFVVIPNPRALGETALIADVGIKYEVDIGFKVQALWGDSNLGSNNVVYLLSNNSANITKVLLLKDENGQFNGSFVELESHEMEAWGVQGADIFANTLYIGNTSGANEYAAVKEISLSDFTTTRIVKQKFYSDDGTPITACVQGIYVNKDSVWICINSGDTTKPVCLTKYIK